MYRLLYINITVITNQKSIIDTHNTHKKESKHNTKHSHQITKEARKYNGEKTVSSISGAGKTGQPHVKE